MEGGIVVSKLHGGSSPAMTVRAYFTFSMFRSARPNRKISTPEISFWMALAVETALGTMGTGFCPA